MNMAPIFLRNTLQLCTYANSTALRAALLQWCLSKTLERIRPRHLEMERVQMMTGRKLTLSRKVRKRVKEKTQHQRGNRTTSTTNTSSTDINTCKNCGKPGHWAKDCWNPGGGAYDNSTYRSTGKNKSKNTSKGEGKHVDVSKQNNFSLLKQLQPRRILRKIRVLLENSRAFQAWTRGSWV